MAKIRVTVFTRFERFAHWTQAVLIICLMTTGFEVNGAYSLFGYERAAGMHRLFAWTLLGLWVFITFWNFVTGEWKQYLPTTKKMIAVIRYYTTGIFDPSVPHPYKKTLAAKHNPLQRLAYLSFNLAIGPFIWSSGLLYLFYNDWPRLRLDWLQLGQVAAVHASAAFAMLCFFIVHVYMAFTGKPVTEYFVAMVTGKGEVEVGLPEDEDDETDAVRAEA